MARILEVDYKRCNLATQKRQLGNLITTTLWHDKLQLNYTTKNN
jgi:hypothetical protein